MSRVSLLRVGVVSVALMLVAACNEGSRVNLETYCPDGLALVISFEENEFLEETGKLECLPPPEATQRAISDDRMRNADANTEDYYATREAERDEMYRRDQEERRKDDIRSCILAGNQPDSCELDPDDPYGTGERRE